MQTIKNCITYKIDNATYIRLHYIDLQILIINFRIDDGLQKIAMDRQQKMQERGITEIEEVNEEDALKYL